MVYTETSCFRGGGTVRSTLLKMLNESKRTRLISQIANVLHEQTVDPETRDAGLTLIGWLARRMPDDPVDGSMTAPVEASPAPGGRSGSPGPNSGTSP